MLGLGQSLTTRKREGNRAPVLAAFTLDVAKVYLFKAQVCRKVHADFTRTYYTGGALFDQFGTFLSLLDFG